MAAPSKDAVIPRAAEPPKRSVRKLDHSSEAIRFRRLQDSGIVAISDAGDHVFLANDELTILQEEPLRLPRSRLAELRSKFFLLEQNASGMQRLLASRIAAKQETVLSGPSLHILVPTLRCGHSCKYCQVSRALEGDGFTMSPDDLYAACHAIFESPSPTLTIEFQGGDPLLRFDLVRAAIEEIVRLNRAEHRQVRFVVASTLHQLNDEMCNFFRRHEVYLSTSVDGPEWLHNRNRPIPGRDSYSRTMAGIQRARDHISPKAVSALMTTSRESLACPEDIVDTYVELGFDEIFVRPLSHYGFARKNSRALGYSINEFQEFYRKAFNRVLEWNRRGVPLREVAASIAFNKMLGTFDAGYVDLQSPTGAGLAVLVYNYDGYVYPSDEARMIAATGDQSLRLGRIGDPLEKLLSSPLQRKLVESSLSRAAPGCRDCAYSPFCGPDPVGAYNELGSLSSPVELTDHCRRQLWLFDFLYERLHRADTWFEELANAWARPADQIADA
jgi:His-Xaa-Ser system radical SAM maturase HxsB